MFPLHCTVVLNALSDYVEALERVSIKRAIDISEVK
jgi:hypothetical protein